MIKSIQSNYIQKSRIFLYPLLEIRRGVSITPKATFMSWRGCYGLNDNKLIATYHLREDPEFKAFEKRALLGNQYFEDMFELEEGNIGAYVFDFIEHSQEFQNIIRGKYSKLSGKYKNQLLKFFKNNHVHQEMIDSYLNPETYHTRYSELLKVPISLIKEVHELYDTPDLIQEKLTMKKKVFNFELSNNL